MRIMVGSLKFSPVFKSLCTAFGKTCEQDGHEITYFYSKRYDWMLTERLKMKTEFIGNSNSIPSMTRDALSPSIRSTIKKILAEKRPSYIYLLNYHFLNHYIAAQAKKIGCKLIYHVHEPYVKEKNLHGGFQRYWLYLFENMQNRLLKKTDVAIVSSDEALSLFQYRYKHFSGKLAKIPLLFEDLGVDSLNLERKYATFVGPPVPAKNPKKFLEIVELSETNNDGFEFLLTSHAKQELAAFENHPNLRLFTKSYVNDEEFGELLGKSYAVITPYTRETQSAVVISSFMYGTPVLSSNVGGMTEFVIHKETGYVLEPDAAPSDWLEGLEYIRDNFERLKANCRRQFELNFSDSQWKSELPNLLV